ncbi:MAG TPA: hypothetical protein DEV81_05675 [Cyanobacteria bacterium UBA11049]|nr:hypothetical protein [Cyanobacteria bacterium UBA11049]
MKIKLDRKLTSCPDRLRCTICRQAFKVSIIRALLYNDKGLIQGDVCSQCLKLKAEEIKQKIREQAMLLMELPELYIFSTISSQERALELLECSTEKVKFPSFYQWLIKKIEVSQESRQLEATKSLPNCADDRRSRLQIFFDPEDEL